MGAIQKFRLILGLMIESMLMSNMGKPSIVEQLKAAPLLILTFFLKLNKPNIKSRTAERASNA